MNRPAAWIDVTAHDPRRSRAFYGDLLGWSFEVVEHLDYAVSTAAVHGLAGGIGRADGGANPAGVLTYVVVDDVGTSLARAERLGGGVAARPWTVPGLGTMAVVLDPDGHRVGLWTPSSDEHHG